MSPIGFLFLKLPPPPCAVLLVYWYILCILYTSWYHPVTQKDPRPLEPTLRDLQTLCSFSRQGGEGAREGRVLGNPAWAKRGEQRNGHTKKRDREFRNTSQLSQDGALRQTAVWWFSLRLWHAIFGSELAIVEAVSLSAELGRMTVCRLGWLLHWHTFFHCWMQLSAGIHRGKRRQIEPFRCQQSCPGSYVVPLCAQYGTWSSRQKWVGWTSSLNFLFSSWSLPFPKVRRSLVPSWPPRLWLAFGRSEPWPVSVADRLGLRTPASEMNIWDLSNRRRLCSISETLRIAWTSGANVFAERCSLRLGPGAQTCNLGACSGVWLYCRHSQFPQPFLAGKLLATLWDFLLVFFGMQAIAGNPETPALIRFNMRWLCTWHSQEPATESMSQEILTALRPGKPFSWMSCCFSPSSWERWPDLLWTTMRPGLFASSFIC